MRFTTLLQLMIAGMMLTSINAPAMELGEEVSLPRLIRAKRYTLNPHQLDKETKVLIAFYSASWCAPCEVIGKKLESLYPNLRTQAPTLNFFTFAVEATARARADYLREKHYPWLAVHPMVRESSDWDFKLPGGTPKFQAFQIKGDRMLALTSPGKIGPVLDSAFHFLNIKIEFQ